MQTQFRPQDLADPATAEAEAIIRKCVHCGFCTATCPTYVTLGNELDSPRGRIYLIKDMLEQARPADAEVTRHVDRCLSCLACTTTCPSGVDYMHLIDHARVHVEKTYRRPLGQRVLRMMLAQILPYPRRFRLALRAANLARPLSPLIGRVKALRSISAMLALAPRRLPTPPQPQPLKPRGEARSGRVALLSGCAQSVLDPHINASAEALLSRFGIETLRLAGETCCGSLVHHMGRREAALNFARALVDRLTREIEGEGLDAILVTASGCGTTIKDYGHLLAGDAAYAGKAAKVAALALDISEYLARLNLPRLEDNKVTVAYHAACSLQHGQKVTEAPKALLRNAGFTLRLPAESHLCCGSAGTYNILQPDIAAQLRERKVKNLAACEADCVATGNIGCMTQIAGSLDRPVLHMVQLLNWAYGGENPLKKQGKF